jgi:Tol biopolymer transport system component
MNADGSNQLRLTRTEAWKADARWSPDGQHIAWQDVVAINGFGNDCQTWPSSHIYVMNANGSNQQRIPNPYAGNCLLSEDSPAWSPDGKFLAFAIKDSGCRVYIPEDTSCKPLYIFPLAQAISGKQFLGITDGGIAFPEVDYQEFAWSPDGKQIAYTERRAAKSAIYLATIDPPLPRRLLTDIPGDSGPVWSPDGRYIAFLTRRDGKIDIYRINADGSNQVNLTGTGPTQAGAGSAPSWAPTWSPDGRFIAFVSMRDGNIDIYRMNSDGSNPVNLTRNPASDDGPAWSPDGKFIAFRSNRSGNDEIYRMDADGSNQVNLTRNSAADYHPAWQPRKAAQAQATQAAPTP